MSDATPLLPVAPAPATAAAGGATSPPPRRPVWGRVARWPAAAFRSARRRPRRALGRVALGLAVVAALAAASMYGYFVSPLRAARDAVARGHNAEAARHLEACLWVRPDQPEVRLLTARVARRSGNWEEAERILDGY